MVTKLCHDSFCWCCVDWIVDKSLLFQNANIPGTVERSEGYLAATLRVDFTAHVKPALWVFFGDGAELGANLNAS